MGRRLNTYVHVHVDGVSTAYGPDDKIPKSVAKLITAPDVWEGDETDDAGESGSQPSTDAGSGDAGSQSGDAGSGTGDPGSTPTSDVPKKNAKTEEWAKYADSKGFDPEGLGRDEIIAALAANSVPVE